METETICYLCGVNPAAPVHRPLDGGLVLTNAGGTEFNVRVQTKLKTPKPFCRTCLDGTIRKGLDRALERERVKNG